MTFKGQGAEKMYFFFPGCFQAPRFLIESTCHRFLRRLKSGSLPRQPVHAPLQVLKVNLDRPGQARLGRRVQAFLVPPMRRRPRYMRFYSAFIMHACGSR